MKTINNYRQKLIKDRKLNISCVVPIYNEQDVIVEFIAALKKQLQELTDKYEIVIVDDGSKDKTIEKVQPLLSDGQIKLISLSRNFGKENAITAGLKHVAGNVTILIDADFQHPIELIQDFISSWSEGFDMVYGVRSNRKNESYIKRSFSKIFYRLIRRITRINIPVNAGDFRLLDRKVVDAINLLDERNRFMKGLYAWVGFSSKAIPFEVQPRVGGISSWRFNRLTELAITGITSFSTVPLRIWGLIGFAISAISIVYALFIVTETLIFGVDVPGFATIVVAIIFFGGIQLFSIGILGEYIARIFNEVKQRPNYIISNKYNFDDE